MTKIHFLGGPWDGRISWSEANKIEVVSYDKLEYGTFPDSIGRTITTYVVHHIAFSPTESMAFAVPEGTSLYQAFRSLIK